MIGAVVARLASRRSKPRRDAGTVETFRLWMLSAGKPLGTVRVYESYARRCEDHCGVPLIEATPDQLLGWMAGQTTWSLNTRSSARTALQAYFSWAVWSGLRSDNPADKLPPIRVPRSRIAPPPEDVVIRALAEAHDPDGEQLMILLAGWMGLRRCEIAAVSRRDLRGSVLQVHGKGSKQRIVDCPPEIRDLIMAGPYGFNAGRHPDSDYCWPGRTKPHVEVSYIGARLSRLLGDGYSGHGLRRRAATAAAEIGGDIQAVQDLLGHESLATTQAYVIVRQSRIGAAVEAARPAGLADVLRHPAAS